MSTEMELAFPTLSPRQIAELTERGTVRAVKRVECVAAGEPGPALPGDERARRVRRR